MYRMRGCKMVLMFLLDTHRLCLTVTHVKHAKHYLHNTTLFCNII